jgi:hypothetical protein
MSLQPPRKLVKDATPTTGFRKWVTTILSTTLVAQNVVLLALLFVYRLKKLNPAVKGKPGSEYRLLTVALMLGNKFLDDNTYTNKTWAEVSGINVAEVHIMEVEFLSNMKYNLFTDVEDWSKWQSLLGKYASFLDRAANPPPAQARPVPILPPASSLQLPMALPSPPASNQASPPYAADLVHNGFGYSATNSHGPTPAPSPLSLMPISNTSFTESKKRSRDDYSTEPPAKRLANGLQDYASPRYPAQVGHNSRLTLPSHSYPNQLGTEWKHSHLHFANSSLTSSERACQGNGYGLPFHHWRLTYSCWRDGWTVLTIGFSDEFSVSIEATKPFPRICWCFPD